MRRDISFTIPKSRLRHGFAPAFRPGANPFHISNQPAQVSSDAINFNFSIALMCLHAAQPGATFLLNAPFGPDEIWNHLPRKVQRQIIDKKFGSM